MADNLGPIVRATGARSVGWQPNFELIQPLLEMGVSENAAKRGAVAESDTVYVDTLQLRTRGLYYTGNLSVDQAASWVFENIDDPEIHTPFEIELEVETSKEDSSTAPLKMVFVVNCELKMGIGKIAAQVAHAGLAIQKKLLLGEERLKHLEEEWEEMGSTKIVLKGGSAANLMEMEINAKRLKLPSYLVVDAGKTQVHAAAVTVLGIFGTADEVNTITGHLPLL